MLFRSKRSTPQVKDSGLPTWAAAVIGVLCALLGVGAILGATWLYRRRRRRRLGLLSTEPEDTQATDNNEERKLMYAGGPASPGPGPVSNSTGVETRTNDSIVQYSINTSISPRTVESDGDAVYEMHGKKHVVPTIVLQSPVANSSVSFHLKIHLLLSFLLNLTFHHPILHHLHHPVHCLTVTPRSPRKAL